jgi:cell wall-associated NlpC family hydrolase
VAAATLWTSPDAPRDVDAAAVLPVPDTGRWSAGMAVEAHLGLVGRTLTQVLLGEPVEVLEERGEWLRVRVLWQPSSQDDAGYPGWLRREHVAAPVDRTAGAAVVVMARTARCSVSDGETVELSFGTWLWLESATEDDARVCLPGGGTGSVRLRDVRLTHKHQPPSYDIDDVLASAAQFLGLRYLWGGTSTWGLDCSGLVHLAFRAHGVVLPRDARDQVEFVEPVALDAVRRGDLCFFAREGRVTHVGFATAPASTGVRRMLHAPEDGHVEEAPLTPERSARLVAAGRV